MKGNDVTFKKNNGGPFHYLGNRFLSLPNSSGRMTPDMHWLNELFSVILFNTHGKKFKRSFEPFAGCASWSIAAMELGIAEEYIINDSDEVLVNTLRLIKDNPEEIKDSYTTLVEKYLSSNSKTDFFRDTIGDYNRTTLEKRSLLLPFIINHSWGGLLYHDTKGNIVYREVRAGAPGNLESASIPLNLFYEEVDRVSRLFNANKIVFKSGDFLHALSDMQPGDFVALNPPYPENTRARLSGSAMYVELYSEDLLHQKLVTLIDQMDSKDISYYMTYGFHDPEMRRFVIKKHNQLRHFFRVLGYNDCAWGIGLDQMYFPSKFKIPPHLSSQIIPAQKVLQNRDMTAEEALDSFNKIAAQV